MLYRNLFSALLACAVPLTSVQALEVRTQGRGEVFIGDVVSDGKITADIFLLQAGASGQPERIPLEQAQGIEFEIHGNDLLLRHAATGKYRELLVENNSQGNRQSVRMGLPGGGSSYTFSSSSSSSGTGTSNRGWPRFEDQDYVPPAPGAWREPLPRNYRRAAPPPSGGKRNFLNQDFNGVDWHGRNLSGASVVNCKFEGAGLAGINLSGAKIVNTIVAGADLAGANFTGARLVNSDFTGSSLQGAVFRNARLVNVDFSEADLTGVVWTDGKICAAGSIGVCR